MPGSKRKIDEDTWIVSQSKKFKHGMLLSSVYETTLAHLRIGARQFFSSLLMRSDQDNQPSGSASPPGQGQPSPTSNNSPPNRGSPATASPYNTPPGSPAVRDIISDNELQNQNTAAPRPAVICQDCELRARRLTVPNFESSGKCAYCEKLVCHLNQCRGCTSEFCKDCCITKYDESTEAYECYGCLH